MVVSHFIIFLKRPQLVEQLFYCWKHFWTAVLLLIPGMFAVSLMSGIIKLLYSCLYLYWLLFRRCLTLLNCCTPVSTGMVAISLISDIIELLYSCLYLEWLLFRWCLVLLNCCTPVYTWNGCYFVDVWHYWTAVLLFIPGMVAISLISDIIGLLHLCLYL